MGKRIHISVSAGFSLIELLVVLAVMGVCLAVASVSLGSALSAQVARGAAESWQAAAARAQVGVLWRGGIGEVQYTADGLRVVRNGSPAGDLWNSGAAIPVTSSLVRWRRPGGASVAFGGVFASPDGGGSVFFSASGEAYRVVVRPESGLTARSVAEAAP